MPELTITLYHVGDGDSALVEFPSGKLGIIDCQKPKWCSDAPVISDLKRRTQRGSTCEVEFVCITHPHADHVTGIRDILDLEGLKIREFWHSLPDLEETLFTHASAGGSRGLPVWSPACKFYYREQLQEFIEFAQNVKTRVGEANVRRLKAFDILRDKDGMQIFCVNPVNAAANEYLEGMKSAFGRLEHMRRSLLDMISVSLLLVYGENAILYTSDIQGPHWSRMMGEIRELETLSGMFPVRIAKASHHGGPRSFYPGMWGDVLGKGGAGMVVASGGTEVHPSEPFIQSVVDARMKLFCTGRALRCGRERRERLKGGTVTAQWLRQYGDVVEESEQACCGDIVIHVPSKGDPWVVSRKPKKCLSEENPFCENR